MIKNKRLTLLRINKTSHKDGLVSIHYKNVQSQSFESLVVVTYLRETRKLLGSHTLKQSHYFICRERINAISILSQRYRV